MKHSFKPIFIGILSTFISLGMQSCKSGKSNSKEDDYSSQRAAMEAKGKTMLDSARHYLANQQPLLAQKTIERMRRSCYLAIECRNQGILLMDSIDIELARKEIMQADSLMQIENTPSAQAKFEEACRKVEFYERKLMHDRQAKK